MQSQATIDRQAELFVRQLMDSTIESNWEPSARVVARRRGWHGGNLARFIAAVVGWRRRYGRTRYLKFRM